MHMNETLTPILSFVSKAYLARGSIFGNVRAHELPKVSIAG